LRDESTHQTKNPLPLSPLIQRDRSPLLQLETEVSPVVGNSGWSVEGARGGDGSVPGLLSAGGGAVHAGGGRRRGRGGAHGWWPSGGAADGGAEKLLFFRRFLGKPMKIILAHENVLLGSGVFVATAPCWLTHQQSRGRRTFQKPTRRHQERYDSNTRILSARTYCITPNQPCCSGCSLPAGNGMNGTFIPSTFIFMVADEFSSTVHRFPHV
jgi:hypothetical protein